MNYIPLSIKTNYDLLCSIIKIEDLIDFSLKNNIKTIGITDPNLFSFMEVYSLCKKNDIKPIFGLPLIINDIPFLVYARNFNGYKNMCNLSTINSTSSLTKEDLKNYSSDLICVLESNEYKYLDNFKDIYDVVYLSYKDDKEKNNARILTDRIVFMWNIREFSDNDSRYLKYLYLIRDGKTIKDDVKYDIKYNHFIDNIPLMDSSTTKEFSELIDIEIPKIDFDLPKINDKNSEEYLRSICYKGLLKRRNGFIEDNYKERLEYELSVIIKMGFVNYFLIVYDFILYAKKNDILIGPGRGSAAGSLVAYSLGIIEIDPIKYDLIFERFLNPDRISLPDIDIDVEALRRDDLKEYIKDKYGNDNVSNIIAFDTLLPKAVIRDVGRVLNFDNYLIDRLCKTIKTEKDFKSLEHNELFRSVRSSDSDYEILLNICYKLCGLKRNTTIHAAGIVISKDKISNICPIYKSGEVLLTSFTKDYLESLGLVKMDLLAISNFNIIKNVLKLIKTNLGKSINLNNIDYNDKKTLDLFKNADTVGIFQFESSGMRSVLKSMMIDSFDDLVAIIALYRPGPREEIPHYINRKHGKEKITYILPELEKILSSTYGIIVYQEQVLEILRVIGGFTYSEADNVRKAMSKKSESIILQSKDKFINGALKKGYDKDKVIEIFDKIHKFSEYGFNKSHSVAYSIIAFWMEYLKANYKEYYMASLLDNVISSNVKTKEYIDEAKILGIELLLPDINNSDYTYSIINGKIILPITVIKNVGTESNKIIEERINNGKYIDYYDFVRRCFIIGINKKIIESLIDAGVLKCFGYNRKTLYENLNDALNYASLCKDLGENNVIRPDINICEEYEVDQLMKKEFDSYGFYYSTHPVTKYRREGLVTLKNINNYFDKYVNIILLVEKTRVIDTKNKDKMAFLTLSDDYSKIEAVMFPKVFERHFNIEKGNVLNIKGKVEKRYSEYQLIINDLTILK